MALDLPGIVAHGRTELAIARMVLTDHRRDRYDLCSCMRPLPCGVADAWEAYARYWLLRLETHEKTLAALTTQAMALPIIECGSRTEMRQS